MLRNYPGPRLRPAVRFGLALLVAAPSWAQLLITSTSLPPASLSQSYSQQLAASGGTGTLSWSTTSSLPSGLSLSTSGLLAGTPISNAGSPYSLVIKVTDSATPNPNTALRTLALTVNPPAITTLSPLTPASLNTSYSFQLAAAGGSGVYSGWLVTTGSLPPGLMLDASTGLLSGIPTSNSGSPHIFTVQAGDGASTFTKTLALAVNPPSILTPQSLVASVGSSYSQQITAAGGTPPYMNFQVTSGSLPPGLGLSPSGLLSGTPTSSIGSPFSFTVTVTDTLSVTGNLLFTFVINPPQITTSSPLPSATTGSPYSLTFAAAGGTPAYGNWTATTLPPGLALSPSTGVLSGTPTTAGTFNFTVTALDSKNLSLSKAFQLTVGGAAPQISTTALPAATVGVSYSATISASGGTAPYSFALSSGSLPPGLGLTAAGAVSGIPSSGAGNTYGFTVQVSDNTNNTATKQLSIAVAASLTITSTTLPAGVVGASYNQTLTATGGSGTLTWSLAGGSALPSGLSLSSNGAITGTPVTQTGSPYSFTVQVTDSTNTTTTRAFTLPVLPVILLTAATLPSATVGTAYSTTFTSAGGTGPYTYSLAGGSNLPPGLSLIANGTLSGTPTAFSGSPYTFTLQAADSTTLAGTTATKAFSLSIANAPLQITTATLPAGQQGSAYTAKVAAIGGTPPYTWAILSGALPSGLQLNTSTGDLTGTPAASGTFTPTFKVTDAASASATQALPVTIAQNLLTISTATPLPAATVGSLYQLQMAASGGTSPYVNWQVTGGSLPSGMTLTGNGFLSGTPTSSVGSPFAFTIQVSDSAASVQTVSKPLTLTVNPPVITSASPLPAAVTNQAYSTQLAASGGTPPYSNWTVTSGTLPAGLTLASATGILSGTPTSSGTAAFTVSVTDAANATASKSLSLTTGAGFSITTATLPDGIENGAYSATLQASGGSGALTWSITSGTLPAGLTLNASTGAISGIATLQGQATPTVKATDSVNATATRTLNIQIFPALSITTASLPAATVNTAYSHTLQATGGSAPAYAWSVSNGTLPPGLTLGTNSGLLSGTPSSSGTFSFTISLAALGSTVFKTYSLTVSGGPLTITTSSLSAGAVGSTYAATLAVTGGIGPYKWTLASGALPAGIVLDNAGNLSGTPTASGTFSFTIGVQDSSTPVQTTTRSFSLSIGTGPLTVTTASLPAAFVGTSYSQALAATGGTGAYIWNITLGNLPAGLSLSSFTGIISGTPSLAGQATFTIQVTDSANAVSTRQLTLTVSSQVTITTTTLPAATLGTPYSTTLTAQGGTQPYNWTLSGNLPPGLSLNASTGAITGTPTTNGAYSFIVNVADSSNLTGSKSLSITVGATGTISITTAALPNATLSQPFNQTLAVTGGTGTGYLWSLASGNLPGGLQLTSAGVLSGTPSAAGSFPFTIRVADSANNTATRDFTLVVNQSSSNLSITTTSLPNGTINQTYSAALTATGGSGAYTWTLTFGALPPGLLLSSAGAISGTPTAAGTAQVTVKVTDSANNIATRDLTLQIVAAGGLQITTASPLPAGTLGSSYSMQLNASGGSGAGYVFTISGGALPQGLTLTATGVISGTPATSGTATFTIRVTDSANAQAVRDFSLTINGAGAPQITTTSLSAASVGVNYSVTLAATGGAGNFVWSLQSGSLPPGLSLAPLTGVISGVPVTSGTFPFIVKVTDSANQSAQANLFITAGSVGLSITTTTLTPGLVGVAYQSGNFAASGGQPPYSWSLAAGTLPPGLALNASAISGTPTTANTYSLTLRVTDAANATATRQYTFNVYPAVLIITSATLPSGQPGGVYNMQLAAQGGTGTGYAWSLTSGTLPNGLTLAPTGLISGTPSANGAATFSAQVADSLGFTATRQFTLVIGAPGALSITTSALPPASLSVTYSFPLQAAGGNGTYSWALASGSLPSGIVLSTSGALSGTPTQAGTFPFTARVNDGAGASATAALSLTVAASGSITITTTLLSNATLNVLYTASLQASGGTAPYTWSVTGGAPPTGISLSSNGILSGTPSQAGTFSFTVRVNDATNLSVTATLSLTVTSTSLSITTASLPNGPAGQPYSQTLQASGGTAPYTWTVAGGQLPAGLTLSPSGAITGTPSTAGIYGIIAQVTDAASASAQKGLVITITAALTITTTSLPGGTIGQAYSQTLAVTGGVAPYTWTFNGTLPAGLTLNPSTGAITGTPSTAGTSTFTLQVIDAQGATGSKSLSITVATALTITTVALPNGTVAQPYAVTLAAAGGAAPVAWSLAAGTLPPGLTIDASSGAIAGAPSKGGRFDFTAKATDSAGATATKPFTIQVSDPLTITLPSTLPAASVGVAYSQTLAASGGTTPYTWTVLVGNLPQGISLSAAGLLAGTPATAGTYSVVVQVTDAAGQTATAGITLPINSGITITTTTLPNGQAQQPYSQTLGATGGTPPYTWAISAGTLPFGITLRPGGTLSGTPSNSGTYPFTVLVTDSLGASAIRALTVTIGQSLTIVTPTRLPDGLAGAAYAQILNVSGGVAPYTWTVDSGILPQGIILDPGGSLSGTPALPGSFSFTLRATDSSGASASTAFQVTIALPSVPAVSLSGLTDPIEPRKQPAISVTLAAAYPIALSGTVTLTFTPDASVAGDDPAVTFINGRRTLDFTIPANSAQARFPDGNLLQTGTVAGALTLTVSIKAGAQDITPSTPPSLTGKIGRAVPVITSCQARRTSAGFEVQITGYATSREITQAIFRFTPTPGSPLQTTELSIPMSDTAKTWYQSPDAKQFGGQFSVTQQFSVSQGTVDAIGSVTVLLSNTQGQSLPGTGALQ